MEIKEILEEHILDHIYGWLNILGFNLPISKHLFMMLIIAFVMLVIFPIIIRSKNRFLYPLRVVIEVIFTFLRDDIVRQNFGDNSDDKIPYFATLFFFILLMNLLGFVPYGATATGNISVTAGLSITTFFLIIFSGIKAQGLLHYLKSFIPSGIPFWLYPIMIPVEVIGLFTRIFALAIRLFANMISGHIVIFVLLSFIFIFGAINIYLGLIVTAPIAVILVLFVSLLELLVSFIQAYIFTALTAIFTAQAMTHE
ncbi:MAG: F0F1 ATP synthase subunit A [Elusimicrobiales bacterium]|nr:F0F1 ATP synthase subunit A [Elusimicrobiales bacterium]